MEAWSQALVTTEDVLKPIRHQWLAGLNEPPPTGSVHKNFASRRLALLEEPMRKKIDSWSQLAAGHRRVSRILAVMTLESCRATVKQRGIALPTWSSRLCKESMKQFGLYEAYREMGAHDEVLFNFLLKQSGEGAQGLVILESALRLRTVLIAGLSRAYPVPPPLLKEKTIAPEIHDPEINRLLGQIDAQIAG